MPSQYASSFWQNSEWNYNKHSLETHSNYRRNSLPNLRNYVLSAFLSTLSFRFKYFFFLCVFEYRERKTVCFSLEVSVVHWQKSFLQKLLETYELLCSCCIPGRYQTKSRLTFSEIMGLHWWIVSVWWGGQLVAYTEAVLSPKSQIKFSSTLIHNRTMFLWDAVLLFLGTSLRESPTNCDSIT